MPEPVEGLSLISLSIAWFRIETEKSVLVKGLEQVCEPLVNCLVECSPMQKLGLLCLVSHISNVEI